MKRKTKILIVDDSVLVRKALLDIFSNDGELEVMATANDPYEAAQALKKEAPDVVTLDIEMPKMNGITFLKKLMQQHPIPVVVISTLTQKGTRAAVQALEYGAVEVLAKPKVNTNENLINSSANLCQVIKAAAKANLANLIVSRRLGKKIQPVELDRKQKNIAKIPSQKVIAIGASTGGTEAIRKVLINLPDDCPGVVIVQHMPEIFTRQFAERLDSECQIKVKEAENGDLVYKGHALIAPGNMHMMLKSRMDGYSVQIKDGPLVNRHKPSVDVLFKSVARYAGLDAVGVLLTGMGYDGAQGMLEMKKTGAQNIAQNEDTCVVFGMPNEAIKVGAVHKVLPLNRISDVLLKLAYQEN